jgi:hypothetical protein
MEKKSSEGSTKNVNYSNFVFVMKQHCDMKIKFYTDEGFVVYLVQVLWDENWTFYMIYMQ